MVGVTRRERYRYVLSLPERVLRSLGAISGGLLKELGDVALPAAIRRTILYRTMVGVTLRFLIEDVGEVAGVYPGDGSWRRTSFCSGRRATGLNCWAFWRFARHRCGFWPRWRISRAADKG